MEAVFSPWLFCMNSPEGPKRVGSPWASLMDQAPQHPLFLLCELLWSRGWRLAFGHLSWDISDQCACSGGREAPSYLEWGCSAHTQRQKLRHWMSLAAHTIRQQLSGSFVDHREPKRRTEAPKYVCGLHPHFLHICLKFPTSLRSVNSKLQSINMWFWLWMETHNRFPCLLCDIFLFRGWFDPLGLCAGGGIHPHRTTRETEGLDMNCWYANAIKMALTKCGTIHVTDLCIHNSLSDGRSYTIKA